MKVQQQENHHHHQQKLFLPENYHQMTTIVPKEIHSGHHFLVTHFHQKAQIESLKYQVVDLLKENVVTEQVVQLLGGKEEVVVV